MRTRVTEALVEALHEGLDALFPPRCWLCGATAEDGFACARHALPAGLAGDRCRRCGGELPAGVAAGTTCADCRRRPPAFRRLVALGDYRSETLREWILALKHGRRPDLARPLGAALARHLVGTGAIVGGELLVPVPLHPLRALERGYDQAARLARASAESLGLELLAGLRRRRVTAPQGAPGARSRRANVRGAFTLARGAAPLVRGRRLWLVDDVVTSRATASACARVLLRAGAAQVGVAALARAAPDPSGDLELPGGAG